MKLKGKTAFVTGGSRGIGRAICCSLAQEGARVAFIYQSNDQAAAETCDLLTQAGAEVLALKADVTDRAAVAKALQAAVERLGKIDVLVNNAGINKPTDFDQMTDADWDQIMAVNLKGPFVVSQEALSQMNDGGSIVMIGSVSGQYGGPRTGHYAASKAGLISLAQVIARFAAPRNIRCNTLAAGLIASEMAAAGLASAAVQQAAAGIPLKRMGLPEEVGRAVCFLASDDASYVTAQTLNVNGGLYF